MAGRLEEVMQMIRPTGEMPQEQPVAQPQAENPRLQQVMQMIRPTQAPQQVPQSQPAPQTEEPDTVFDEATIAPEEDPFERNLREAEFEARQAVEEFGADSFQAKEKLQQYRNLQIAESAGEGFKRIAEERKTPEALGRRATLAGKGLTAPFTLGISDQLFKKLEKESGGEIRPEDTPDMVVSGVSNLIGAIMTGRGFSQGLRSLTNRFGLEGAKQMIAIRLGTAGGLSLRNLTEAIAGDKSFKDAAIDSAIQIGSAGVSMVPEQVIPSGVANWFGQVLTDFVVDFTADKFIRKRIDEVGFKQWFLMEELPQLATSVMFASQDAFDPGFEGNRQKFLAEITGKTKERLKKQAIADARKQNTRDAANALASALRELDDVSPKVVTESLNRVKQATEAGSDEDIAEQMRIQAGNIKEDAATDRDLAPESDVRTANVLNNIKAKIEEQKAEATRPEQIKSFDELARALEERTEDAPRPEAEIEETGRLPDEQIITPDVRPEGEAEIRTEVRPSEGEVRQEVEEVLPKQEPEAKILEPEVKPVEPKVEVEKPKVEPKPEPKLKPEVEDAKIEVKKPVTAKDAKIPEDQKPKVKTTEAPLKDVTKMKRDDMALELINAGHDLSGRDMTPADLAKAVNDLRAGREPTLPKQQVDERKGYQVEEIEIDDNGEVVIVRDSLDIEGREKAKRVTGSVRVPSNTQIGAFLNRTKKFVSRKAGTTRGLVQDLFERVRRREQSKRSIDILSKAVKKEFQIARNEIGRKIAKGQKGKKEANKLIDQVIRGGMELDEFKQKFKLEDNNRVVKFLENFLKTRRENSIEIANKLRSQNAPEELVTKIMEDQFYLNRFYEKHYAGVDFEPDARDYEMAIKEISKGFEDSLKKMGRAANKLSGTDAVEYLRTGDTKYIEGLPKTKQNEAMRLNDQYQKYKQIIDGISDETGKIEFSVNARALRDAAQSVVDFHLQKDSRAAGSYGSIDASALKKRHLDVMWQNLYGRIDDPVFTASRTIDVQGKLIEDMAFFEDLYTKGRDKWWSELRSNERGHTKQVGTDSRSDRAKYGQLAGKYVSPDLAEVLVGKDLGQFRQAAKTLGDVVLTKPMSTMRLLKLIGLRTIGRNYATALTGFATGNGDIFQKGYVKNLKEAHKLLKGVVANDPAALRKMAEYEKKGVFSARSNSIKTDLEFLLKGSPGNKYNQGLQQLGEWYALIDMPTKVASYETAKANDMSEDEAVEHVRKFYQNAEAIPEGLRDLGKLPISDYPGYWFDSIRISKNQIQHAIQSAKNGDFKPMTGFMISKGLQAAWYAGFTVLADKALREGWEKMKKEEKSVVGEKKASKETELSLRPFLPEYYRYGPLFVTQRTRNGKPELVYTVTANQFAFPLDDTIIGAMQAGGGDFGQTMKSMAKSVQRQRLGPGMLMDSVWKFFTGEKIGSKYKTKGLVDLGSEDDDAAAILMESTKNLMGELYGGQVWDLISQLDAVEKKQQGIEPRAGAFTTRRTKAEVWKSKFAMWRVYSLDSDNMAVIFRNNLSPIAQEIMEEKKEISRGMKPGANLDSIKRGGQSRIRRMDMLKKAEGLIANAKRVSKGVMTEEELFATVKSAMPRLSKAEINAVFDGTVSELPIYEGTDRLTAREKFFVQ